MKIVIATEAYYPLIDGGAVAEHHLALELAKRNHQVHILAPSLGYFDGTEHDEGTTIHRLWSWPLPFLKNDHRAAWRPKAKIDKILDSLKPDVVHIHNFFPIGRSALLWCKKNNVPVVATNHWLPENMTTFIAKFRILNTMQWLIDWNWRQISLFHNQCQFVTSPTQTAVDLMVKNGLTVPHKPVSNGVELDRFNPQNEASALKARFNLPNRPTALYAGRLSGEKHVDVLIKAIPEVLKVCDAHFVIGGSGREKPALIELAKTLGVSDHVTFPGFLNDDEFPLLYRCADVFVIPSICELQSITTLEAMASGLPVLAANKYALPELCHHGQNGYLFEAQDHATLATQLIELFQNPVRRHTMGQESLTIVARHSLPETISHYESIYHQIIG